MAHQIIRISLKAYDHSLLDKSTEKIIDVYNDTLKNFNPIENISHFSVLNLIIKLVVKLADFGASR